MEKSNKNQTKKRIGILLLLLCILGSLIIFLLNNRESSSYTESETKNEVSTVTQQKNENHTNKKENQSKLSNVKEDEHRVIQPEGNDNQIYVAENKQKTIYLNHSATSSNNPSNKSIIYLEAKPSISYIEIQSIPLIPLVPALPIEPLKPFMPLNPPSIEPKDNRIKEAKQALEAAEKARSLYMEKLNEFNQDNLISSVEKQLLDQLKEAYDIAKEIALKKYEDARTAPLFHTLTPPKLTDLSEVLVNDVDNNHKNDMDEREAVNKKITEAKKAWQAYHDFFVSSVEEDNGAVSTSDLERLVELKKDYDKKKAEAEKLYQELDSRNRNDETEEVKKLTSIDNLPETANDINSNGIVDSVELASEEEKTKQAKNKLDLVEGLMREYKDLFNRLVTNDSNSISQTDIDFLNKKKQEYDKERQAVSEIVQSLSLTNSEKSSLEQRVNLLETIVLPVLNDIDNNHVVDQTEIAQVEEAINRALEAKEAYESKYKELVTDDATGTSEDDLHKLTELKTIYDEYKNAAQTLYESLAKSNQSSLTSKFNELADVTLPSLTPTKPDKEKLRRLYQDVQDVKTKDKYLYDVEEDKISFSQALEEAKTVLEDENAQADRIEQAYRELKLAFEKLNGVFEKKVEFRSVTSTQLYTVSPEGDIEQVTGLTAVPSSLVDYLAVIENNGNQVYMPIHKITEENDKFKVILQHPELHTYLNNEYVSDFSFEIEKIKKGKNIYTNFADLMKAIQNNPEGEFLIGADMLATSTEADFYIQEFRGQLKSVDGKKYAILNQNKPLFNKLKGRVENVTFKNVRITSTGSTGTIAIELSNNALVKNVYIEGELTYAPKNVESHFIGGVAGTLLSGATLENVWTKMNLTVKDQASGQYAGLLAGRSAFGNIRNSYAEGNINLTGVSGAKQAKVGRIMGYSYSAKVNNIIVNTTHNSALNGIQNIGNDSGTTTNIYTVSEQAVSNGQITKEQALAKLKEWKYFFGPTSPNPSLNSKQEVEYSSLPDYDSSREIAYKNTEKLLPFYDRHTIIKYGNLIPKTNKLFTKEIKHLSLMSGEQFTTNVYDKEQIDQLFIVYEDEEFEKLALKLNGLYKDTAIVEYELESQLLFTPNQFVSEDTVFWTNLTNTFNTVELNSSEINAVVGLEAYNNSKKTNYTIKELYLDDSFASIKQNLDYVLKSLVSKDTVADIRNSTIKRYVERRLSKHKEAVLLGISYLNRLYNIQFDAYNIKPLMLYDQSFYNASIQQLEQLKNIGNAGFASLFLNDNYNLFQNKLSNLNKGDLLQFLDKNRNMFAPNKNENEWFKESTKAFVYEHASTLYPTLPVELYPRLKNEKRARDYILPLLNLNEENVYVVSAPATLYFGGYGRSIDQALKTSNLEEYKNEVKKVQSLIKERTATFTKFIDFLYNLSDENQRNYLSQHLTQIFDGYYIRDSINGEASIRHENQQRRWATKFDSQYTAIKDFFGPIGRYYERFQNNPPAYIRRDTRVMHFDDADILGFIGPAILSHELIHSYDEAIVLGNNPYRQGQNTESYAVGLFESMTSGNSDYYGFNFMYDIQDGSAFNHNISRFLNDTKEDIKQYIQGVFDATYLLNGIEAEIITAMPKNEQKLFYRKIRLDKSEPTERVDQLDYQHGTDVIEEISESEWNQLDLNDINDLIDHNIVSRNTINDLGTYYRDNNRNYYYVSLYYPNYSGYQNDTGTVGGLNFKLYALELMAEYGWDKGFVPYASNKYKKEAHQLGQVLSDTYILNKIFAGVYPDYSTFKKAMYAKRMAKKDEFKSISVYFDNKTHRIESYQDLKALMQKAVDSDLEKLRLGRKDYFARATLKKEIMKAFNAITNDFTTSIFNE